MRRLGIAALVAAACANGTIAAAQAAPPAAAEPTTVGDLLEDGFTVVSSFMTPTGAVLFLQNDDELYFCVLIETSTTQVITTRYCKAVE